MTLQRAVQFQKLLRPPSFISAEYGDQSPQSVGRYEKVLVQRISHEAIAHLECCREK